MHDDEIFDRLKAAAAARDEAPSTAAKKAALDAGLAAFNEKFSGATKETHARNRLSNDRGVGSGSSIWRRWMQSLSLPTSTPRLALAGGVAAAMTLVITFTQIGLIDDSHRSDSGRREIAKLVPAPAQPQPQAEPQTEEIIVTGSVKKRAHEADGAAASAEPSIDLEALLENVTGRFSRTRDVAQGQRSDPLTQAEFNELRREALAEIPPEDEGRDRFTAFDTNPVKVTAEEPVSTFSIDVDTASYAFARASINRGVLPQPNAVRVEEFINYFDYAYERPASIETPFSTDVALTTTPWNPETQLLRIGLQGFEPEAADRPRANLVFLIDTSGSMNSPDKLPLLKQAFRMIVQNLDAEDRVAIVTYAGSAGTVLEPTSVADKSTILSALDRLQSGGSTAGGAGITLAYSLAEAGFDKDAVNRVILATDGDFNVGIRDQNELKGLIERKRDSGVFLSVLGFGRGNLNDALMQTLAQNGNGQAAYIDTLNEARKVLVEEAGSALIPIAKGVKIQVEFNPATVAEYRLIGYETRTLNREDFNNDKTDAGEIGAGHQVTALYELTPAGSDARLVDDLRYTTGPKSKAAKGDELGFVRIRYQAPDGDDSKLITRPVTRRDRLDFDSERARDFRFASAVAGFGQLLRGGQYTGSFGFGDVIDLAQDSKGDDPFGYRAEFIQLARLAQSASAGE